MNTTITGGTKLQRTLINQGVETYARKLMPDSWNQLDIRIECVRGLYDKDGAKGDCCSDDEEQYPREFEIRLDSAMHPQALLRALAHEMVHVKQYATRHLVDSTNRHGVVLWKGKIHEYTGKNYWDQPWEIEAYGREIGLLEHFVKVRRYAKKRWYRDTDYL